MRRSPPRRRPSAIAIVGGLAFFVFAAWTLRGDTLGEEEDGRATRPTGSVILAVGTAFFLAELGDKTMLATITLATREEAIGTWLGSTVGMVAADAIAIARRPMARHAASRADDPLRGGRAVRAVRRRCSSPKVWAGSRSACEPRRAARIEGHRTRETEMSWQTPDKEPPPEPAAQPPDAAPAPEPEAETARSRSPRRPEHGRPIRLRARADLRGSGRLGPPPGGAGDRPRRRAGRPLGPAARSRHGLPGHRGAGHRRGLQPGRGLRDRHRVPRASVWPSLAVWGWRPRTRSDRDARRRCGLFVGVDFLYFVGLWTSGWHGTLGMRLMRLRVLGAANATTLSFNDALLRWIALSGAVVDPGARPGHRPVHRRSSPRCGSWPC